MFSGPRALAYCLLLPLDLRILQWLLGLMTGFFHNNIFSMTLLHHHGIMPTISVLLLFEQKALHGILREGSDDVTYSVITKFVSRSYAFLCCFIPNVMPGEEVVLDPKDLSRV